MQFLIVLAAALACVVADPQLYTTGYKTVVPAVGYPGGVVSHPGFPAGVKNVAYTSPVGYTSPLAYTAPVAYTGGYNTYPVGYTGVVNTFHRARRDAVYPLTTAYTHPIAYSASPYTYKAYSPIGYSPVAEVPSRYNYGYAYPTFG